MPNPYVFLRLMLSFSHLNPLARINQFAIQIITLTITFSTTILSANSVFDNDEILNKAPHLSKLLEHSIRPTMDEVYAAAKADGLLEDKELFAKFDSKNSEVTNIITTFFVNLEKHYPGYRLYTLGRDAVAYSDYFDAIAIYLGKKQRAIRVNLSGETARHADPKLLRQYLLNLGMPQNKSELRGNSPIVFMDYTDYGSTSQLRRLIDILLSSLHLSDDEKSKVHEQFAALTSNSIHNDLDAKATNHIGPNGEALWSINNIISRAQPFNGKFDSLVQQSDNSFVTIPGPIEAPSPTKKKKAILEMLGYLFTGKTAAKIIAARMKISSDTVLLEESLNQFGASKLSLKLIRRNIRSTLNYGSTQQINHLMDVVSSHPITPMKLLAQQYINQIAARQVLDRYNLGSNTQLGDPIQQLNELISQDLIFRRFISHQLFSKPHSQFLTEQLKRTIELADGATLRELAISTFSKPHTKNMTDLLRLLIEKADRDTLKALAQHTFSKPHTEDMQELLKLIIEKADESILYYLSRYTFTKLFTSNMTATRIALVKKAKSLNYTTSEIEQIERELDRPISCESQL